MGSIIMPDCPETRPCFARTVTGKCGILTAAKAPCSFCKPNALITKGVRYDYNRAAAAEKELPQNGGKYHRNYNGVAR